MSLPIVIKAKKNQSTSDVIRQFKKATVATDIVQKVRDRRYFVKPALERAVKKNEQRRLKKRHRSLKRMKNISEEVLTRIANRR